MEEKSKQLDDEPVSAPRRGSGAMLAANSN